MRKRGLWSLLLLLLLVGCDSSVGGGLIVWIDVPVNPTTLTEVQPIHIEGHTSSPSPVASVEIWINGALEGTVIPTAGDGALGSFEVSYTPGGPGEYIVQVVAISSDGESSEPDTTVVTIMEAAADLSAPPDDDPGDETPTPTPVDPTPVPDAGPVINYWAEPAEIEAGGCTTIHWEVANVSTVVFGGREQDFNGSYDDCMCETQTYPMTITYLDGSSETFRVTINVNGTCEPPTPVPDTVGPNPPTQLKPTNGSELACTSGVMLRWEAANDPSGIGSYRIQVERHSGDNNWQAISGSPFTGITGTEKEISVECGWYYRWRIRAIDGAGNLGDFSGWFTFSDLLS